MNRTQTRKDLALKEKGSDIYIYIHTHICEGVNKYFFSMDLMHIKTWKSGRMEENNERNILKPMKKGPKANDILK